MMLAKIAQLGPTDFLSIGLCVWAAACCFIRAELFRKRLGSPFHAGKFVRLVIDMVAVALVARAIEIAHGSGVSWGSLWLLAALALSTTVVLVSMLRRGWERAVEETATEVKLQTRAEDTTVVREAVHEAVDVEKIKAAGDSIAAASSIVVLSDGTVTPARATTGQTP